MFNPREAFSQLDGRSYADLRELLRALGRLRWDHLAELPVSFGVSELLDLARARHWLIEKPAGGFSIHLDTPRGKRQLERSAASKRKPAARQARVKAPLGA